MNVSCLGVGARLPRPLSLTRLILCLLILLIATTLGPTCSRELFKRDTHSPVNAIGRCILGRKLCVFEGSASTLGDSARSLSRKCRSKTTLVTAYFAIDGAKHSASEYNDWIARFFHLPDNMVIYTDAQSANFVEHLRTDSRGCSKIHVMSLYQTYFGKNVDWVAQHLKDDERNIHVPELYIVWSQKALWLAEVAEENPFQSEHFFWSDSGQFRDSVFLDTFVSVGETWTKEIDFLPSCNMALLSIEPFQSSELVVDSKGKNSPLRSTLVRVGAGNFGGDACAVKLWREKYIEKVHQLDEDGLFVGKEQSILGDVCIENMPNCFLIPASDVQDIGDKWFAMQPILHGVTRPVPRYNPIPILSHK